MSYSNINNPVNYQLQGFGQNGVRTISTDQLYIQGEYYRVLVAEEDSYVTAVSVLGDDLTAEFVYAGTTIYGLFTEVSVSSGSLTAYIAGPTDIEDVWAYINAYGQTNAARIEAADCAKDAIAPLLDKYYAKASLVMVPSLYKTSIVYSERPLTTDGQLAFTRSNDTATRVGPDGYIEKVRTNLALYSEQFDDAYWTKTATVTANTTISPSGYQDADTLTDASNSYLDVRRSFTITASTAYTFSIFVKKTTGTLTNYAGVGFSAGAGVQTGYAIFNTTTGAVNLADVAGGLVLSAKSTSYGDYYRFEMTFTTGQTSLIVLIYPALSQNGTTLSSNAQGSNVFWGAQLETGDIATNYIPTTASAVSVGPVANLPRLNYPINSDGSVGCPSLLLEPQRVNIFPKSESSDTWSFTNMTRTGNHGIAPDGYQSADLLAPTTSGVISFTSDSTTSSLTIGQPFVCSFFIKLNQSFNSNSGQNIIDLRLGGSALWTRPSVRINLVTGSVTEIQNASYLSSTNYGNGWFRITFGAIPTGTTSVTQLQIPTGTTMDGGSFYIWGLQGEANATYATSYIPTLGAAVTRGADTCSKTGVSSLIGQTEGTLFCDVEWTVKPESGSPIIGLVALNNTTNLQNCIVLGIERAAGGANRFYSFVQVSNSTTAALIGSNITNGRYKAAFAYKENDFVLYVNGVQIATDTSGAVPTNSQVIVGGRFVGDSFQVSDPISQNLLFKTRLTNQELQDLTTL